MSVSTKSKTSSVKLDAHVSERLSQLAILKKRTSHYLMREAISLYVEQEHLRQKAILEAKASWENYQETGKHITLDEFDTWVDDLEKDANAPIPECHV
jgi:predicted transcriptional regulator